MERVEVVKVHVLFSIVCAVKDATDDEILQTLNSQYPSETSNGWCVVVRPGKEAYNENQMPIPCQDDSERQHIMVAC